MNKTHLYFPINKCATTSFKKLFKKYNHIIIPNLNLINNNNNLHLIKLTPEFNKYYKFTIIRHPIKRFLSSINMFIRDNKLHYINNLDYINNVINIIKNYKTYEINTINGYIKRHTLPMSHELYCIVNNNNIVCDYIIKLENLSDEWINFTDKININNDDIIEKRNKSNNIITMGDLNDKQKKFLYNYYKKDFELFNYK